MKKSIFILTLLIVTFSFPLRTAKASVNCQPIYGGGQTCISSGEIQIDKKVRHPESGKGSPERFVDNLSINEARYHAGDQINFRLSVTNTGNANFESVEVKDVLPEFVSFVSGPGKFDANKKTLTFSIRNLKANETKTETIGVKVVGEKNLPLSAGVVCTINQSSATSEGKTAQDNAQFCIEKGVPTTKGGLPVMAPPAIKQTPATGPEMLPLISLIPAGLAGILLRRKKLNTKR